MTERAAPSRHAAPIYVETFVRGSIEEVWRRTQTPDLHERWDLRFTSITYLPRASDAEPQRFRYATRIGFGVEIAGFGETVGTHDDGGARTSALKFGSDDRRSLIRAGSGYWKYAPVDGGVRFITAYDYEVRFGALGRVFDKLVFRPLMGRATAWSFDRLRLWIEEGVDPGRVALQAAVHGIAALAVAFVWLWHGIVPKLAGPHPEELALLTDAGVSEAWARPMTALAGVVEIALGLALIPLSRRRWPWVLTIVLMVTALLGVVGSAPQRALAPFNPVTLNLLVVALAVIGLLARDGLPAAGRCLRAPREGKT